MRHINGVYRQAFNRRHQLTGHLFQGRYKAILVDSDSYLLEVCRYVDLNPVRARMVERPDAYLWSSYRALIRAADKPDWLDAQNPDKQGAPRKANVRKIQSSAPALASDIKRYTAIKHNTKAKRNQNIAHAFYQGGHTQTAIASAFDLSSSTVSRVVKECENEQ